MKLVLLSGDLMFGSRVESGARKLGLSVATAGNHDAAVAVASEVESRVLVVDLRAPGLSIESLVAAVRESPNGELPVIACAPHVHEAKLTAARKAGCDRVISRGQLDRELESILEELL